MSEEQGDGFLSRWSRRKSQARQGSRDVSEPPAGIDVAETTGVAGEGPTPPGDAPAATVDLASLPDIETLTATSDITAFLQRGVPAELQRLALRKMWQIDPVISNFIEVAENQYDFNNPDSIPGFGALDPSTDVEAFVARLFSDPATPSPAAADGATGDRPAAVIASAGDAADGGAAHAGDSPEDMPPMVEEVTPPRAAHAPALAQPDSATSEPARVRRHGGALPT